MSMKSVGIIIIIILVAVGGYIFFMGNSGGNTGTPEQNAGDVVQAEDRVVGTGAQAEPGSIVSVLYVGKLSDGTVFDSSEAHGNEPLVFQLGTPGIISGFQIGVNGMREGGERIMAIPPAFGYGAEDVKDPSGAVVIPGDSTLIFEIKLLTVEPPPAEDAAPSETP